MTHILLRRTTPHQNAITGDGSAEMIDWNDVYEVSGNIQYDAATKKVRLLENGLYLATMSLPYGNLNQNNTCGAGWFHGGVQPRHEPFIYNGNPFAERNPGGVPGGGSDIINCGRSHQFLVDIEADPFVWVMVKIGGNPTKNVTLLYDAFFAITKLG